MIRLHAVNKRFGSRTVLHDLNLAAHAGAITLVAGPNGAGKSTLLHIMAGLCRPDGGTVTRTVRDGAIGYLGHAPLVYPALTALENLAFWSALHGLRLAEEQLLDALAAVELDAFADEPAGTFSRGMVQRLSLVRMLLLAPSLVLLDEPLTGLDQSGAARMRGEFARLKGEGAAIVWVTHDLAGDAPLADEVLTLERGGKWTLCSAETYCKRLHNMMAEGSA